jgi:protein-S-isoprenylcysteine O-methyltransferase Ste14
MPLLTLKGLVLVKTKTLLTKPLTLKKLLHLVSLSLAISGFVPGYATALRTVVMTLIFFFSIHLINEGGLTTLAAAVIFCCSTAVYIGFIYLVLPENGWRHWFIRRFGSEKKGSLAYEALLSLLFFINGTGLGYVNVAFAHSLPVREEDSVMRTVAVVLFVTGWVVKIWATKVVGVDIYYWKDMFYGRKISPFVAEGPYKFINNPMYGIGQLQTYATALWYASLPGLAAALIYQLLVFSFYHFQEKKFIQKIYLAKIYQHAA